MSHEASAVQNAIRSHLVEWLDGKEFYTLCQRYRATATTDQQRTVDCFEGLKRAILRQLASPAIQVPKAPR